MSEAETGVEAQDAGSVEDSGEGAPESSEGSVQDSSESGQADSQPDSGKYDTQLAEMKKTLGDQGNQVGQLRRDNEALRNQLASQRGPEKSVSDPWAESPHLRDLEPKDKDLFNAANDAWFQQRFGVPADQFNQQLTQIQSQVSEQSNWNNQEALAREVRDLSTQYPELWEKHLPQISEHFDRNPGSQESIASVFKGMAFDSLTGQSSKATEKTAARAAAAGRIAKPTQRTGSQTGEELRQKILDDSASQGSLKNLLKNSVRMRQ